MTSICSPTIPVVNWANTARWPAGRSSPPNGFRRIYDHQLIYVVGGHGQILVGDQIYPAEADRLFLMQPRVWHSIRSLSTSPVTYLGIHFDWEAGSPRIVRGRPTAVIEELFREPREIKGWCLAAHPFLDLKGRSRVRKTLEEVVWEHRRRDTFAPAIAGALLAAAIGQIEREVHHINALRGSAAIGADAIRRVHQARELLEQPRQKPLTVEEVAGVVGWTADHLRRMFRVIIGVSPAQIQTIARIQRAKDLLVEGGMPMEEIAWNCGFADRAHLSRVFKQETGQTPRDWRLRSRGQN